MEVLVKIAQFILSISFLIVIHEMGHFFFARLFKTRVEKFYLFFDVWFSLFKFKKGDCEYGIGWLPLGGYIKISGMIDESIDTEQLKKPAQPWEFRSKPAWQRLLIMTGGVMVNFIGALIIFAMILYVWGEEYLPNKNVKYGISVDSVAYNAGLRNGDKILSIDEKEIEDFAEVSTRIVIDKAKTMDVLRDSTVVTINFDKQFVEQLIENRKISISVRVPFVVGKVMDGSAAGNAGLIENDSIVGINGTKTAFFDEIKNELQKNKNKQISVFFVRNGSFDSTIMKLPETGLMGVQIKNGNYLETKTKSYGFFEAIPAGIDKGFASIGMYVKSLGLLFTTKNGHEQLGGFISIGNIFPGYWDWQAFWGLTAFLSVMLAFMNILPIPALDGGHVLFLLYEIIARRKPSDKFLEYAQISGMILLFSLLIYANLNDVIRLFF